MSEKQWIAPKTHLKLHLVPAFLALSLTMVETKRDSPRCIDDCYEHHWNRCQNVAHFGMVHS